MRPTADEVAKLASRGTLDQAHDEFEPPCHLCDKQIVSGESYVYVKFNDDRTRYAVCLPCANRHAERQILALDDWRRQRPASVQVYPTPNSWRLWL